MAELHILNEMEISTMTDYKTVKNRQFEAMLVPAVERLKKYTPDDICKSACIAFDESLS